MLGSQYRANEGFQFFFSFLLGNLSANSHRKMISDRHRTLNFWFSEFSTVPIGSLSAISGQNTGA
jgi:hypothetical protein